MATIVIQISQECTYILVTCDFFTHFLLDINGLGKEGINEVIFIFPHYLVTLFSNDNNNNNKPYTASQSYLVHS